MRGEAMTIWRIRFNVRGGHVHCGLFAAKGNNMTFAKCGDFTVRRGAEFADLMRAFHQAQFIGVEGGVGVMAACNEG